MSVPRTFAQWAAGRSRKTDVELFSAKLKTLEDQYDLISDLEMNDTLDRLMEEFDRQGSHNITEMDRMIGYGAIVTPRSLSVDLENRAKPFRSASIGGCVRRRRRPALLG